MNIGSVEIRTFTIYFFPIFGLFLFVIEDIFSQVNFTFI